MSKTDLNTEVEHHCIKLQKSHQRGKLASGILIILFGVLFLLERLHFPIPTWLFSWQMILTAIGIVVLIKHKFRKLFGYVLLFVAQLFLFSEWYPKSINTDIIFPILLIGLGISFIFKSKRSHHQRFGKKRWKQMKASKHGDFSFGDFSQEDFLDATSIFGGVQKNVVSKNFKGADIVAIFGGNEINLSQADFEGTIIFDITCLFGGTTLTVPSNWQVNSEIASIFGGIEDKRPTHLLQEGESKIIILRGTCLFGGIEINSYQK